MGGKGWGGGKWGEMTKTLYAHMNKRNLKINKIQFILNSYKHIKIAHTNGAL
jgi:hypothetical protein